MSGRVGVGLGGGLVRVDVNGEVKKNGGRGWGGGGVGSGGGQGGEGVGLGGGQGGCELKSEAFVKIPKKNFFLGGGRVVGGGGFGGRGRVSGWGSGLMLMEK